MNPDRCKSVFLVILLAVVMTAAGAGAAGGTEMVKIALITPEGSTWTETLYRMAEEVRQQTAGAVDFKIYAGGVSGDELDVLRKMQVGRIDAAGFSGVGLGQILPSIRILEAPLLFRSTAEVDHVKERLYDEFAAGFEKKGYVLLGFAEAGFVYFFSSKDLSGDDALQRVKMWVWKGDPVAETFLDTFGIRAYPLHVTDVNTGLETGMIDAFYAPPLAALAFQWYARVRYMLDYPMVNSTGALLMRKAAFDRLDPKSREVLKTTARKYCRELVRLTRRDTTEAFAVLEQAGIRRVPPTPAQKAAMEENALKTYQKNMPRLYSKALFDSVERILKPFRAAQ